jgi:predicted peptidase
LLATLLVALALGVTGGARAESEPMATGFLNREVKQDGQIYPYVVYVPRNYEKGKKLPVILFLHGAGERGNDGLKQSEVGLGRAVRMHPERYPALVVMPQCPEKQWWDAKGGKAALKAMEEVIEKYDGDRSRLYLTGLSMGGYGSWTIAADKPELFAAVAPVCGGGDPKAMAERLKSLPLWVFHGDADQAVPVARSREMVEAIRAAGSTVLKYTEMPGVGHNSWDAAYENPEFATWLFAQQRPEGKKSAKRR